MKIAVSNIAWPAADRDAAYALLRSRAIRGLEIAPGLFFDGAVDPLAPMAEEAGSALAAMRDAGLELVSMQSLLFGVSGAALFEGDEALSRFRSGLLRAIALAERFSIPNLVFGSPRQRNVPEGMSQSEAFGLAVQVIRDLGDAALAAGTRLGIEFNPAVYGTNFLNDGWQALAFVDEVDHPAVTLILDIGAMHMNGHFDQIEAFVERAAGRISHVHLSEPHLAAAPAVAEQAARVLSTMMRVGYQGWYSIEMAASSGVGLAEVEQSFDRMLSAVAMVHAPGGAK